MQNVVVENANAIQFYLTDLIMIIYFCIELSTLVKLLLASKCIVKSMW